MNLKFLLVQNNACIGDKLATFAKVENILSEFKDLNVDFIVFPEVWSVGWDCSLFKQVAEDINNSDTIKFLKKIAVDFNSAVIGGSFIQSVNNNFYNTVPVISKKGDIIATYNKMHLFSHKGCEENLFVNVGNELIILNYKGAKLGLSVCYDIRFPELYRAYSQVGANVLINMAAWSSTKPVHWEIMHRARAIENQCFMIAVNQAGFIKDNEFNLGHSMFVDGWGNILKSLDDKEGALLFEINIEDNLKLRKNFPLLLDRRDDKFYAYKCKEIYIYE